MYVITWTWLFRCNSPRRCLPNHCLNPLRLVDLLRQGRRAEDLRHIALEERIKEIREKVCLVVSLRCAPPQKNNLSWWDELTNYCNLCGWEVLPSWFFSHVSCSFIFKPPVVCWVKPCNRHHAQYFVGILGIRMLLMSSLAQVERQRQQESEVEKLSLEQWKKPKGWLGYIGDDISYPVI